MLVYFLEARLSFNIGNTGIYRTTTYSLVIIINQRYLKPKTYTYKTVL